ncbi:MAG: DnaD domain protein [Bacilli bacterium]|nr:DnaD domain protein [Bacilli bacterium]
MEGLRRNDRFTTFSKGMISAPDYQTLTLLYQPIMGQSAFVLYCTLLGLLDRQKLSSQEYFHSDLESIMDLKIEDIEKARYRLEAIGLIDTYYLNDHFIYELKLPLSADSFVNDGVLGEYLISSISKDRFIKIIDIFKIKLPNKKQYLQITKSFDEIFSSISSETNEKETDLMAKKIKNNINVSQFHFDWRLFEESIPKDSYNPDLLTSAVKEKIMNLAFVYALTEMDARDVYLRSIDNTLGSVSIKKLAVEARALYKTTSRAIKPELVSEAKHIDHLPVDPITYFKVISPLQLLKEMSDGMVSSSDLRIVERLIEDVKLDRGVVNVLLAYTAKIKNGVLPGYDYFEKVGMSWVQNQITSVELAINYVKHLQSQYDKQKTAPPTSKRSSKANKPDVEIDWLDEYLKSIE